MRYVAQETDESESHPFAVHDSHSDYRGIFRDGQPRTDLDPERERNDVGPLMTEAEAGIIAFALNAIAEGRELVSVQPGDTTLGEINFTYDGPTEGVRAS